MFSQCWKSMVIYLSLTFVLLTSTNQGVAVTYEVQDDFSNPELPEWELRSDFFSPSETVVVLEHQWELERGYLKSGGELLPENYNLATYSFPLQAGAWQISVFIDNNTGDLFDRLWWTSLSSLGADRPFGDNSQGIMTYFFKDIISTTRFDPEFVLKESSFSSITEVVNKWVDFSFVKTKTKFVVYVGNQEYININLDEVKSNQLQFNYFTIFTNTGSLIRFDNFRISKDYQGVLNSLSYQQIPNQYITPILISIFILGIMIWTYSNRIRILWKFKSQFFNFSNSSKNISAQLNQIHPLLPEYLFLLATTNHDLHESSHKTITHIPSKLNNFRFLLNPYRLGIMKLLNRHDKLSAIEIKEILHLSWSEYSNNIKILKKRGLVRLQDEFVIDTLRQFVYLEEYGRIQYNSMIPLLVEFLTNEIPDGIFDNYLYPDAD